MPLPRISPEHSITLISTVRVTTEGRVGTSPDNEPTQMTGRVPGVNEEVDHGRQHHLTMSGIEYTYDELCEAVGAEAATLPPDRRRVCHRMVGDYRPGGPSTSASSIVK